MKYKKLNTDWNADRNVPIPKIKVLNNDVLIEFRLNPNMKHADKGLLTFFNCYAYRLDTTNDEGYFMGQFRFKQEQLPWGEFYELSNTKWEDSPEDKVMGNPQNKNLKQFIFFFKDDTFECLAERFEFKYLK